MSSRGPVIRTAPRQVGTADYPRAALIDCAQVNFAAAPVRIQWQSSPAGRAPGLWSARSTLVLFHRFNCMTLVAVALLAQSAVAAADLATYREFTLGMSTSDVLAHARGRSA